MCLPLPASSLDMVLKRRTSKCTNDGVRLAVLQGACSTERPGAADCTNCCETVEGWCPPCPAGEDGGVWIPGVKLTRTPCVQCVPGKYKTDPGEGPCTQCEPGKASAASGATSNTCSDCPADHYSNPETSQCLSCPTHSSSPPLSSGSAACKCNVSSTMHVKGKAKIDLRREEKWA
jgi:hypothetical protein